MGGVFFCQRQCALRTVHGIQAFTIVCGFIKNLADFLEIRMGYLSVVTGYCTDLSTCSCRGGAIV